MVGISVIFEEFSLGLKLSKRPVEEMGYVGGGELRGNGLRTSHLKLNTFHTHHTSRLRNLPFTKADSGQIAILAESLAGMVRCTSNF